MAALVVAVVVAAEAEARPRVRREADAVALVDARRARERDLDGDRALRQVWRKSAHVDRAEEAARGELAVHVGESTRVVRLAFAERHVRAREALGQHVLLEVDAAERVTSARVEHELDV